LHPSLAVLILAAVFTTVMCMPTAAMQAIPATILASGHGSGGLGAAALDSMASPELTGETVLAAATGIYAQTDSGDSGYQTACRCAPNAEEFCQGTLGDTDIFLSVDGMKLNGADSSTCRPLWEYEFSEPLDKLAIDTTSKLIFFSSGDTVYALSLLKKELVFSEKMPDNIKNISLQPRERLSVDLVNGERHYVSVSMLNNDKFAKIESLNSENKATTDSTTSPKPQTEIDAQSVVSAPAKQTDTAQ